MEQQEVKREAVGSGTDDEREAWVSPVTPMQSPNSPFHKVLPMTAVFLCPLSPEQEELPASHRLPHFQLELSGLVLRDCMFCQGCAVQGLCCCWPDLPSFQKTTSINSGGNQKCRSYVEKQGSQKLLRVASLWVSEWHTSRHHHMLQLSCFWRESLARLYSIYILELRGKVDGPFCQASTLTCMRTFKRSKGAVHVLDTAPAPPPATRCRHHIPVCLSSTVNSSGTVRFSPTSKICKAIKHGMSKTIFFSCTRCAWGLPQRSVHHAPRLNNLSMEAISTSLLFQHLPLLYLYLQQLCSPLHVVAANKIH